MAISSITLAVDNSEVWSGQQVKALVTIVSSTTTTITSYGLWCNNPAAPGYFGTPTTISGTGALTATVPFYVNISGVAYDSYQYTEPTSQIEQFSMSVSVMTADGGTGTSNTVTLNILPYSRQFQGFTDAAGYSTSIQSVNAQGVTVNNVGTGQVGIAPATVGSVRFDSNIESFMAAVCGCYLR